MRRVYACLQRHIVYTVVASAAWIAGPQSASATYVCAVQKSADGYVALRATPVANGALIAHAKAGQAVVIQQHPDGRLIEQGRWVRVFYFPNDVIPPKTEATYTKGRIGWMHRRYVNDCG